MVENIHKYGFLMTKQKELWWFFTNSADVTVYSTTGVYISMSLIQSFHPVSGVYDGVNFPLGSHAPLMTDHLWRIFSPPPALQAAFNI